MKLYHFKIAQDKIIPFIRLCEGLEITILVSWLIEGDIFTKNQLEGYLRIHSSITIPETMQLEKLEEKFGNNIKPI